MENTLLTCEGLHARGYDVTLLTGPAIGPEGELMTRARSAGYEVVEIPSLRREVNPLRDFRAYKVICDYLASERPDIMHSHASKAGILARKAAAKVGTIKVVHTIHGLAFGNFQTALRNRLYIALERKAATRTDAFISVANAMTTQALAAGIGTREQFTTIYSSMDVERFITKPAKTDQWRESFNLPKDGIVVTSIARLAELKGHEFILDAAEKIDDPRIVFCFVGDGPWRDKIAAEISHRNLTSRFRMTGLVHPDEIPAILHASDIVAHCSLREGLARVIPQALLAEKPVISYDVDGAGEVVDAKTGILLDPKDVFGLALSIETLADCKPLRDNLGQAGQQRCREMFDHNRMVDKIEKIYNDLAG